MPVGHQAGKAMAGLVGVNWPSLRDKVRSEAGYLELEPEAC